MNQHLTRRTLLAGTLAASTLKIGDTVANDEASLPSIPIGWPDLPPGLGFRIGHGFQSENSWYLPGYWHCGEDWYANDRDSGGALVYAMQDGEVVFVGSEYPGRVVIIQHGLDLYSMYGHLDPAVEVSEGQSVNAGQPLGKVLLRNDGIAPSHLHLETRTFLFTSEVNGDQPRYGFACGQNCAPGPGYWPMNAPDLPVEQGWRNPMHIFGAWIANHLAHVDLLIVMATDDMSDLSWWTGSPLDTDRTVVQTGDLEKGSLLRSRRFTRVHPKSKAQALLRIRYGSGRPPNPDAPDGFHYLHHLPKKREQMGDHPQSRCYLSPQRVGIHPLSSQSRSNSAGGPMSR